MQQWIKPENFSGEEGTIGVYDFLDIMEMTLMGMERHILEEEDVPSPFSAESRGW